MKKKILIITAIGDIHATEAEKHVNKNLYSVVYLDPLSISDLDLTLNITSKTQINLNGDQISRNDICSIWFRKPYFSLYKKLKRVKSDNEIILTRYLYDSNLNLFKYLMSLDIKVLNNSSTEDKSNKILDLNIASKVGFRIPNTIFTKYTNEIIAFAKNHKDGVITKKVCDHVMYNRKLLNIPTNEIKLKEIAIDKEYKYYVCIQEKILKKFELRVIVVGDKIFAGAFDSQSDPKAQIDGRMLQDDSKYWKYDLKKSDEEKILKYMKMMNLNFAAFDFAVDLNDELIFFEANPNGQYLWIEKNCGLPISKAIADYLMN